MLPGGFERAVNGFERAHVLAYLHAAFVKRDRKYLFVWVS